MLAAIICRIRDASTAPCRWSWPTTATNAYGTRRCRCCSSAASAARPRPSATRAIRDLLNAALAGTGITDASGQPLRFTPHDFRRIFITDAIMNGMPPHIAQLVAGHHDINTTMGYKAVYPEEVINGHRAFIARRRDATPRRGIPHAHRRGMGGVPRPLRTPQGRPRRLRPRLRDTMHPRARLHPLRPATPRPAQRPRLAEHPRQPARPHRRSPPARLARRSRRTQNQPRRGHHQTRPARRTRRPPRHRRAPGHARIPPNSRPHRHNPGQPPCQQGNPVTAPAATQDSLIIS